MNGPYVIVHIISMYTLRGYKNYLHHYHRNLNVLVLWVVQKIYFQLQPLPILSPVI